MRKIGAGRFLLRKLPICTSKSRNVSLAVPLCYQHEHNPTFYQVSHLIKLCNVRVSTYHLSRNYHKGCLTKEISSSTVSGEKKIRASFADNESIEVHSDFVKLLLNSQKHNSQKEHAEALSYHAYHHYDNMLLVNGSRTSTLSSIEQKYPESPFASICDARRWYSSSASENYDSEGTGGAKETSATQEKEKPSSKTDQLKKVFAIYGSFGIAFHIVMSLTSLGICYLVISSGVDVIALLSKLGIELSTVAGGASTMVLAYAVHKMLLPLRASITIVSVPMLVRYLRRVGYLKK